MCLQNAQTVYGRVHTSVVIVVDSGQENEGLEGEGRG